MENLNASKWLLLVLCLLSRITPVGASPYFPPLPVPMKYVNEYPPKFIAPVLAEQLERKLAKYEAETGSKMIVVVIESTDKFCTIQEYVNTLGEQWDIAQDREDDKSILIVVASEDEASHILLGGALRDMIPPATLAFIRDKFIMKIGFYTDRASQMDQYRIQDGINKAVFAFYELLSGKKTPSEIHHPPVTRIDIVTVIGFGIVGLMFIAIIWLIWNSRYDTHVSAADALEKHKTDFSDIYYWLEKDKEKEEQRAREKAKEKNTNDDEVPKHLLAKNTEGDIQPSSPTGDAQQ